MSHLSNVGFPIDTQDQFVELIEKVLPLGNDIKTDRGVYIQFCDSSNAELHIQIDNQGEGLGANPHFNGSSRTTIKLETTVTRPSSSILDGAYSGWVLPDNLDAANSGSYPIVFDVPNFYTLNSIQLPAMREVQIAAFAHKISVYSSKEAFQNSGLHNLGIRSFIPSGTFTPDGKTIDPPESLAIITGTVVDCEEKTNSLTQSKFHWMLVDSYDAQFDVVCDIDQLPRPPKNGDIVSGSFWLSGKVVE